MLRRLLKSMESPRVLRWGLNLYPPLIGTGIRVLYIADDYSEVQVAMFARFWNKNYVGTHFGGSLYTMTDPFYMIMVLKRLGNDFIVWDKSAEIDYRKPGRGTVKAIFKVTDADLDDIRSKTQGGEKHCPVYSVDVVDAEGEVVASIRKTLFIKRKS